MTDEKPLTDEELESIDYFAGNTGPGVADLRVSDTRRLVAEVRRLRSHSGPPYVCPGCRQEIANPASVCYTRYALHFCQPCLESLETGLMKHRDGKP